MKLLLSSLLIAFFAVSFAGAEPNPGYRHEATFVEERSTNEEPPSATIFVKLADETPPRRQMAIQYEVKTRMVMRACWMSNGMFEVPLPKAGLLVPKRPDQEMKVVLMLSADKITNLQTQNIALVGFYWGEGPK